MFFVVVLHILGHGGVLDNSIGTRNDVAWLLEIIAYCAVDIYAMISGYVGYSDEYKPFKSSKYISMWFQVLCYSFGVTLIAYCIKPQLFSWKKLIKAFFPVASGQYWYFTAFTGLFLLKPWLNRFIRSLSKKELTALSLLIFAMFSVYSTFAKRLDGDPFVLSGGYCVLWIVLLYIVGAWIKKCSVAETVSSKWALLTILLSALVTWIGRQYIPARVGASVLVSYISPTVLLSAVAYVIIFSKVKLSCFAQKIVAFFAPAAFGVYLVHVQPMIWKYLFNDAFVWITDYSAWKIPFIVIGCAVAVFAVCILIEKLRIIIFDLLKVDVLAKVIGERIDKLSHFCSDTFACFLKADDSDCDRQEET